MIQDRELRFAVLIDAENISEKYIKTIMDETANFGIATYKRIYGDWTNTQLISWKNVLLENSIVPIHQYSYTSGKNSTDSAMIIDAMDILYSENVEGFCIVSSDSDFTKLASRLREAGKTVIGMGEKKTPKPFIAACNQFKYLDILYSGSNQEAESARKTEPDKKTAAPVNGKKTAESKAEESEPQTGIDAIRKAIVSIVEESSDEEGWIYIGDIGNQLAKRFPDFDVRNYGFKKLTPFIRSLNLFEVRSETSGTDKKTKLIYIKSKQG